MATLLGMLLPPTTARQRILEGVRPLGSHAQNLVDAHGYWLAKDLLSPRDLPAFTHSTMDGYAVTTDVLEGDPPYTLSLDGESRAGAPLERLGPSGVCRIFTGAVLPEGANAVIKQEDTTRDGNHVTLLHRPEPGEYVRRQGADLKSGAVALKAGTRLKAGALGLAASLDHGNLPVFKTPSVAMLSTGDELRAPGEPNRPGSIIESNTITLGVFARQVGASVTVAPFVRDDRQSTMQALSSALERHDVVVTIGGASVGDHDHVQAAAQAIGVDLSFWGVALKPGKPVGYGRKGDAHLLCLPGNPASATVTFLLFGVPLLRALAGDPHPVAPHRSMRFVGDYRPRSGRTEVVRGRIQHSRDGGDEVLLAGSQASGAITSFAHTNALIWLAPDMSHVRTGDLVPVVTLNDIVG